MLQESIDVLIKTPVAPVYRLASLIVPDEKMEITCSHDCKLLLYGCTSCNNSRLCRNICFLGFQNLPVMKT